MPNPQPEDTEASTKPESKGGLVVVALVAGLVLLFGGAYLAAYFIAGDKVPRGTSVEGIEIGGLGADDARQKLRQGVAQRMDEEKITVKVDKRTAKVAPADLGFSVDYDATLEEAGAGRSWAPGRLWSYFTGGGNVEPVVRTDEATYGRGLRKLTSDTEKAPRNGKVRFVDGELKVIEPVPGRGIDPQTAQVPLHDAYVARGGTAELDVVDLQPQIDEADVQEALDRFGNAAVAAPITLNFRGNPIDLSPAEYGRALSMKPVNGELEPRIDTKQIKAVVDDHVGEEGAPEDASVEVVDGRPRIVPAQPGVGYDPKQVSSKVLELAAKPDGQRQADIRSKVVQADFTNADARKLQIEEKVSSFTTYWPHADYRNTNIGQAAENVDGTVLKPGETFSLNETVGERTAENGFAKGYIIADGIFKEDYGGGVSQMATTTFNAAFFAGLEDVEHKPHSFYIDRYPVGREATVAWPTVDLKFKNDSPYGVLVDAHINPSTESSDGSVTVSIYSTKRWDITSSTSERYNYTSPDTRRLDTPDCYPNTGYSGFDVDVVRYFHKPGEDAVHHQETLTTTYTPSDTVICE